MRVLFVFNGRNAGNIAAEARAQYPEHDLFVIREDADTLPAPEGLPVVTVGDLPRMTWRTADGPPPKCARCWRFWVPVLIRRRRGVTWDACVWWTSSRRVRRCYSTARR